jgi:hypothetical protein
MSEFKVGDEVSFTDHENRSASCAVIVRLYTGAHKTPMVSLEVLDSNFDGHNLNGMLSNGQGWNVPVSMLEHGPRHTKAIAAEYHALMASVDYLAMN